MTAIIVAFLTVALLGMAAIVIDISALHAERRELQNGADASALALARDCGTSGCGDVDATAAIYADANAEDGTSTVESVEVDEEAGTVTVTTTTREPDGSAVVPFGFGRILGRTGQAVQARAVAAWGFPGGAGTVPLVLSWCEWARFEALGLGVQTVYFHDGNSTEPCNDQAGQDLAGGFGWLVAEDCLADIDAGGWVFEDPGSSPSTGCDAATVAALVGQTILVPIFDGLTGTGANGQYHIYGFAAFELHGYRLGGSPEWNVWAPGFTAPNDCRGDVRCLVGNFTEFVATDQVTSLGGPDMGVVVVKLAG